MPPEGDDTAAVYSLQDGRHKYILHQPGPDEFYDLRITSYNVCYTKLLRRSRKRGLRASTVVAEADAPRIARMLPHK